MTTRAAAIDWKNSAKSCCVCPQFPLRQLLPVQTQNAEVAPLVAEIHTHGQSVSVGARYTAAALLPRAAPCRLRFQFLTQLYHQFRHHFFGIPLNRTSRLSRPSGLATDHYSFHSCFSFSKVDLLIVRLHLISASITQKRNANVIGNRPSHLI